MEFSFLPQYAHILQELHAAWNTVQSSKTLRIVLIEGESGMKKSELVRAFLNESQAPCIVGRCSDIPEPYLPFRLAYESLLELEMVQEELQKSPEEVTEEQWQIALTTFAQALRMVQPTGNPVWEQVKQWESTALVSSVPDSLEAEGGSHPKPISFPEVFM